MLEYFESYEHLLPGESSPGTISTILSRFGKEFEREDAIVNRSGLVKAILGFNGNKFQLERTPEECPYYKFVLAESLLVGLGNPTDIERLNQILCGCTVTSENTMGIFGPLSGRRGDDYRPKSQCWRLTIELARLVKFMKTMEEPPPIVPVEDENALRKLLDERGKIQENNKSRQFVFSAWKDIQSQISPWFTDQMKKPMLPTPQEENTASTDIVTPRVNTSKIASQLNIGGPEYQELTDWVETIVLKPMLKIVGKVNTSIYLSDEIYLFSENTAEKCSARLCQYRQSH